MPSAFARDWALDPAVTFLNHGSFGACPRPVLEVQRVWRDRLEEEPVRFLARELGDHLATAREALAGFVGADPDDLAFVANATGGANAVLRSLHFQPGDELIATDHDYNAILNVMRHVAERDGARVIVVDGSHGPGMLELDLRALGAAYYTGNLHKWVCAPKGSAFLHVRRDRQAMVRPTTISHGLNAPILERSRFRVEFDWQGTLDPTAWLAVPAAIEFGRGLLDGGWPAVIARNRELALYGRHGWRRVSAATRSRRPRR